MIQLIERRMVMPAPPCSMGVARNVGSQKKSPQFANITEPVSSVASTVRRHRRGPKSTANGFACGAPLSRCFSQSGDSGTLLRTQSVNSAGSAPTTNSQRQASTPRGSTSSTRAAAMAARM